MVQRYEQKRRLQWYKRGAAYKQNFGFLEGGFHKYWNRNKAHVTFNKGLSKLYLRLKSCSSKTYSKDK